MTNIREVLATNIKENRRRLGLTQEKLAELADVSTHYIAMIETCNKYPKPEMLERLAKTLNVEPYKLFSVNDPLSVPLDDPFERLHHSIKSDIAQAVIDLKQFVKDTLKEEI